MRSKAPPLHLVVALRRQHKLPQYWTELSRGLGTPLHLMRCLVVGLRALRQVISTCCAQLQLPGTDLTRRLRQQTCLRGQHL